MFSLVVISFSFVVHRFSLERRERLEERRVEKESEERRCRCAKRKESRETLCFSNDLWLRRVEK